MRPTALRHFAAFRGPPSGVLVFASVLVGTVAAAGSARAERPAPPAESVATKPPAPDRFASPPPDELPVAVPPSSDPPGAITGTEPEGPPSPRVSDRPRRRGHFPQGLLLPIGLNVGVVGRSGGGDAAFLVGAEASIVKFPLYGPFWAGGYVDAVYDGQIQQGRFSMGPEIGWVLLGVDAGIYGSHGKDGNGWGLVTRGFLSLGFVLPYVRGGFPMGADPNDRRFIEGGVLLKLPLTLIDDP